VLSLGTLRAADTFIPFDYPGATFTRASGINADGAAVGSYVDSAGKTHGFLLRGGSFTTIDYPGAVASAALGINSQGGIVGQYTPDTSGDTAAIHGFLLQGGNFTCQSGSPSSTAVIVSGGPTRSSRRARVSPSTSSSTR